MNFSEKFIKELNKFKHWIINENFIIKNINENETEININDIDMSDFKEPGRNKLECYIKELVKDYILYKGSEIYDDYRQISIEFKNYKPKKQTKETKNTKNNVKNVNATVSIDKLVTVNKDSNNKNNNKLKVMFVDKLSISKSNLIKLFGMPIVKETGQSKKMSEWCLKINERDYFICNGDEENNFNINSLKYKKKDIKNDIEQLKLYIDYKSKNETVNEIPNTEIKIEKIEELNTINEINEINDETEEELNTINEIKVEKTEELNTINEIIDETEEELNNNNEKEHIMDDLLQVLENENHDDFLLEDIELIGENEMIGCLEHIKLSECVDILDDIELSNQLNALEYLKN